MDRRRSFGLGVTDDRYGQPGPCFASEGQKRQTRGTKRQFRTLSPQELRGYGVTNPENATSKRGAQRAFLTSMRRRWAPGIHRLGCWMERCWRRLEGLAASIAYLGRRLGPWPLVFGGLLWMVPVLCRRLSGDTSIGVLSYPAFCAWFRLWGQAVAAAGSIAVFGNGHWRRRSFALLLCAISIGGELANLIALGLETAAGCTG